MNFDYHSSLGKIEQKKTYFIALASEGSVPCAYFAAAAARGRVVPGTPALALGREEEEESTLMMFVVGFNILCGACAFAFRNPYILKVTI